MKQQFIITSDQAKAAAQRAITGLTFDKPMVVEIKPHVKKRNNGQNSLQWVGMLADYSMQVVIDGRQFAVNTWHEHLKEKFLPEQYEEGITLKGYQKWLEMPDGSLKMIGSTTKLTTRGMSEYMEKCYAYGAQDLGIMFTASPNQCQS